MSSQGHHYCGDYVAVANTECDEDSLRIAQDGGDTPHIQEKVLLLLLRGDGVGCSLELSGYVRILGRNGDDHGDEVRALSVAIGYRREESQLTIANWAIDDPRSLLVVAGMEPDIVIIDRDIRWRINNGLGSGDGSTLDHDFLSLLLEDATRHDQLEF